MISFIRHNKVMIGGVLAAGLLVFGYFMFFSGDDAGPLLSSGEVASPVSQELLVTLSNLRTIRLDETIFNDSVFVSLSDFGVVIPPAATGRRNPFAPLGASGAPISEVPPPGALPPAEAEPVPPLP